MGEEQEDRTRAFEEAELYDPAAPDAAARLDLLEHLAEQGVTIDQMTAAEAAGELVTAAADRRLLDIDVMCSPEEVARRSGLSVERLRRLRLAGGFPMEEETMPAWVADDMAGSELAAALFGEGPVLAFSRVLGASAARVADAAVALFLNEVNTQLAEASAPPLAWAEANEEAARLVDVIEQLMTHLVREHLRLAIARQRQRAGTSFGPEVRVAIAFVDLAGSTQWAANLPVREHADALARFEATAWDITHNRGGRIVKLIGDEAMFTCGEPEVACRIALELCTAIEKEPSLPSARGAVGWGMVATRDGDYYGSLVNVVSRCVKAATEGSVVVTDDVHRVLTERRSPLRVEALDPARLRGIEDPVPLFTVSGTESPAAPT